MIVGQSVNRLRLRTMRLFIEGVLSDLGYEMCVLPFAVFRTSETVQSAAEDGRRIGRQDTGVCTGRRAVTPLSGRNAT